MNPSLREEKKRVSVRGEIGTWGDGKGGGEEMERSSSQLKRERKKKKELNNSKNCLPDGWDGVCLLVFSKHQTSFSVALTTGRSFAARINEIQVTNQRGKAESIRLLLFRSRQTATFSLGNSTKCPFRWWAQYLVPAAARSPISRIR